MSGTVPSRQTAYHRKRDVERLQLLAGDTLHVVHDDAARAFVILTPPLAAGESWTVGGTPLYRAHRYEVAAAWLAGYQTGVRYGGRV